MLPVSLLQALGLGKKRLRAPAALKDYAPKLTYGRPLASLLVEFNVLLSTYAQQRTHVKCVRHSSRSRHFLMQRGGKTEGHLPHYGKWPSVYIHCKSRSSLSSSSSSS